jgi:hypothetical protein
MARRRRSWKTKSGIEVRSGWEKRVMDALTASGIGYDYEARRFSWSETIAGARCSACSATTCVVTRYYTPDLFFENGVIVELKGKLTPRNRKIMKAVREEHPEIDLRIVFQRDNKMGTKKWHRYSDWAEWLGIEYAIGDIPKEWTE